MELIRNLPNDLDFMIWYEDLKRVIFTAKIIDFDLETKRFICNFRFSSNSDFTVGYIALEDYSIYPIKNPFDEIDKMVYAYLKEKEFDENLKMWHLTRKDLLEQQVKAAKYKSNVIAKITSFYNDELAFCEFGAGLFGNISLANYLHVKKCVYSIADLLQIGSTFKAKIDTEYKENYFALNTFEVDCYYIPYKIGDIIPGKVLARIEDSKKSRYSYWFMVTERIIGIIKSDFPLGYGQKVFAKVHSQNENFIKFRFNSYIN